MLSSCPDNPNVVSVDPILPNWFHSLFDIKGSNLVYLSVYAISGLHLVICLIKSCDGSPFVVVDNAFVLGEVLLGSGWVQ